MKTLSFILLFVATFCFYTFTAVAQPTTMGTIVSTAPREIKGTITVPRSLGISPATFIAQTKTRFEATSYTMINGQLSNPQPVTNLAVTIADVSVANSTNQTFAYSVKSVNFPLNKPISMRIKMWCYANCNSVNNSVISFTLVDANEKATLTAADTCYENYNFKGSFYVVP